MKTDQLENALNLPLLSDQLSIINTRLGDAVSDANQSLSLPAQHVIKGGGKRLRSILVLAFSAKSEQKTDDLTFDIATAVELLHLGTIVHDDIIDMASNRWNKPTVHITYGIAHGLLIGDFLLAKSIEIAANVNKDAAKLLSETLAIMTDAQSRELSNLGNLNSTIDKYKSVISGKTASLTAAACMLGAERAGYSKAQISAAYSYGQYFGMAFQMIDDLMDLLSTPILSGKPVGNDLKSGVYTLPVLLTLKSTHAGSLQRLLKNKPQNSSEILQLLIKSGAIKKTRQEIDKYNKLATESLKILPNSKIINGLRKLPEIYAIETYDKRIKPQYSQVI